MSERERHRSFQDVPVAPRPSFCVPHVYFSTQKFGRKGRFGITYLTRPSPLSTNLLALLPLRPLLLPSATYYCDCCRSAFLQGSKR